MRRLPTAPVSSSPAGVLPAAADDAEGVSELGEAVGFQELDEHLAAAHPVLAVKPARRHPIAAYRFVLQPVEDGEDGFAAECVAHRQRPHRHAPFEGHAVHPLRRHTFQHHALGFPHIGEEHAVADKTKTHTDHHADGWGIAFFEGKGMRMFVDHLSAAASPIAEFLQKYPIKSRNIIAHVRKATYGEVNLQNAHPFTRELWGRHWVFAHNGDLHHYAPNLHSHFHPVGTTDSEQAFCWLMQELAKSHASLPSIEELTHTLRELIPQISSHGTFNFLLSNGDALWAHCSTKLHYLVRQHPFAQATLMDRDWTVNFEELNQPGDRAAVIVTTQFAVGP